MDYNNNKKSHVKRKNLFPKVIFSRGRKYPESLQWTPNAKVWPKLTEKTSLGRASQNRWNSISVLSPNFESHLSHPSSGGETSAALTATRAPHSPPVLARPILRCSEWAASPSGWRAPDDSRVSPVHAPATRQPPPSSSSHHHTPLRSITAKPVRHDAQAESDRPLQSHLSSNVRVKNARRPQALTQKS